MRKEKIMSEVDRKFDIVVMNPPYNAAVKEKEDSKSSGSRSSIYEKFVTYGLEMCKQDGILAAIHPPKWRKPEDELYSILSEKYIRYLKIYSKRAGQDQFSSILTDGSKMKVGGAIDWYILQNKPNCGKTKVDYVDMVGKKRKTVASHEIDLTELSFLPSADFEKAIKAIAMKGDEKCNILYSYSAYESRKPWMSMEKHTFIAIIYRQIPDRMAPRHDYLL